MATSTVYWFSLWPNQIWLLLFRNFRGKAATFSQLPRLHIPSCLGGHPLSLEDVPYICRHQRTINTQELRWMGEIQHHFENMFTGESSFQGFLGSAGFRPSTACGRLNVSTPCYMCNYMHKNPLFQWTSHVLDTIGVTITHPFQSLPLFLWLKVLRRVGFGGVETFIWFQRSRRFDPSSSNELEQFKKGVL